MRSLHRKKIPVIRPGIPILAVLVFLPFHAARGANLEELRKNHAAYRATLDRLHGDYQKPTKALPDVRFFLFGMGPRQKLIYRDGKLLNALSKQVIRSWPVASDSIFPSDYTVHIRTTEGKEVFIAEDTAGVWVEESGTRAALSRSPVKLPSFAGNKYAGVLKVLHQEILVNIDSGIPLPNFLVYRKSWHRDGAMMGMVLKESGNLHLIKEHILGIRDPYDRNNHTEEPDNLGQVLFLVSLVSDRNHPVVATILNQGIPRFSKGTYIQGPTDGGPKPVYQTKWLKFGMEKLGIDHSKWIVPDLSDAYGNLFWMGFKPAVITGKSNVEMSWPYLSWARAHYYGDKAGALMGNREYPLTWETGACCADYAPNDVISSVHRSAKEGSPHTWHSAEMFLYLLEAGGSPTVIRHAAYGAGGANLISSKPGIPLSGGHGSSIYFSRDGRSFSPLGKWTPAGSTPANQDLLILLADPK